MIQKETIKWRYKEEESEWMNKKNTEQKKLVRKYTCTCARAHTHTHTRAHTHTHTFHEGVEGYKGKETRKRQGVWGRKTKKTENERKGARKTHTDKNRETKE